MLIVREQTSRPGALNAADLSQAEHFQVVDRDHESSWTDRFNNTQVLTCTHTSS